MTIKANAWYTVHYITQDFKQYLRLISYLKYYDQKVVILGSFFTLIWARVYRV